MNPSSSAVVPRLNARPPRAVWKYAAGLGPAIVLWAVLVGWLAYLLYARANWTQDADRATVREWLDEARNFRKTLPELVREYVGILDEDPPGPNHPTRVRNKADELHEHMRALCEPARMYAGQLPLFPDVYRIEVRVAAPPGAAGEPPPVVYESPVPRPRQQNQTRLRTLEYHPLGRNNPRATIVCEYRLHAFNRLQRDEQDARKVYLLAAGVLVTASLLAVLVVVRFLKRERAREVAEFRAEAAAEHRERELLASRLKRQEAERATEELGRKLLEQELAAARLAKQADAAERSALELKSELYASIGIMAGSYAHNIKNLLVRPNDLLTRCLDAGGASADQNGMLREVKATLGTVTERLQQILRTVRRDPTKAEPTRLDLNDLVRETHRTWADMAWDKWKLRLTAEAAADPLVVTADLSHLQQAVENLVFNARDATFEMRNELREAARRDTGLTPAARRQRLIDAASWKGEIHVRTWRDGADAVLEVRDNGIGMTDEVRENCLKTHFTTKRDNALYEGLSAGMGLGLSFVAMVLDHHGGRLEIESAPHKGATFRVRFPLAS